ncbi:hypothetical protein IC762_12470 [Bradyrhizobium genosp. L]|uniref:hypothetical protein n=1 Tax=Bradyrhizobium genosp. L TaxID=83637 RepID=UPI0018A32400|nr:hypothetical protein [Bradyrhizobium genosp. L]QPF81704.1 hypothetical protein IC762_17940 [Bradyrhizobium genosp. L]QPF87056.1 hypothetical protein IC762_12470 [Bradyrhizobium genosp. L]
MGDEKFFYSKSGFAPYSDGSGFKVTVTIEQETEESEPTISFEDVWRIPASEWVSVSRKIERLLDLVQRPASPVGNSREGD